MSALCLAVIFLIVAAFSVLASAQNSSPAWRTSLRVCWTDVTCNRALVVSHGGDWGLDYPYDSMPAFNRAYEKGADVVKGDFRVSSDNVGVITHSSPIEIYESVDCWGKYIEKMTVAQITSCHMLLTNYTFASLPELLSWSEDKVIVMLCVKRAEDIARAISSLIELNATDRVFLEIKVPDLLANVPSSPGFEQVYYLAEAGAIGDITNLLNSSEALINRSFTVEFDSYSKWKENVTDIIFNTLHPHGIRSLATTSEFLPSVAEHEAIFNLGFDVVYTYDLDNAIIARTAIDQQRGISPPASQIVID